MLNLAMLNLACLSLNNEDYLESGLITDIPDTLEELKRESESWDTTPDIRNWLIEHRISGTKFDFLCFSKTHGKGYPKCEVCMVAPNGCRRFVVLKQIILKGDRYGAVDEHKTTLSMEVMNGGEKKRKRYIVELYKETKVTQMFLAHLFGVSQSKVSKVLKKAGVKHPKRRR